MAERRMFAKKIVNSAKFIKMPPTSRLLYYDLGMAADDEGVVEAFTVMRLTGATEDDLRVLVSKDFVKVINDELVSVILDWKQNNLIKSDRFHKSLYHDLLVNLNVETNWNTIGTQMEPESSIGKDSIGKESKDKDSEGKETKHKFGEYKNVLLTDSEYDKLHKDYPNASELITYLDEYIEMKGYKAKSHNLAIRKWVVDAVNKENKDERKLAF